MIETNDAVDVKFAAGIVNASVSSAVIFVIDDARLGSATFIVTVSVKVVPPVVVYRTSKIWLLSTL